MKKLITLLLSVLMIATCSMTVFAWDEEPKPGNDESTDDHQTLISYKVEESYEWSAPVDISFEKNLYTDTKPGTVSITKNIIAGGKTLNIHIMGDAANEFKVTSRAEDGSVVRNFAVNKGSTYEEDTILASDAVICSAASGVNAHSETLAFTLLNPDGGVGAVLGTKQLSAGEYSGLVNFKATID